MPFNPRTKHKVLVEGVEYTLPDDWKTVLGEEVLSRKISVSDRLETLGLSVRNFKDCLKTDSSFISWYNVREESKLNHYRESHRTTKTTNSNPVTVVKEETIMKRSNSLQSRYSSDSPLRRSLQEWKELIESNNDFVELNELPESSSKDFKCTCTLCKKDFYTHLLIGGYKWGTIRKCPKCFGNRTILEKKLDDFIASLGFTTTHDTRTQIFNGTSMVGKEIDILIPDANLGIEVNGALTHNSEYSPFSGGRFKPSNYHKQKTESALENGIKLIHIWEHYDWKIIKDLIASKLGVYKHKIYARSLDFVEISSSDARQFLSKNHLHGFRPAARYFALVKDGTTYQVITYRKLEDCYEISRLATELGCIVVGGFEKLLKNSVKLLDTKKIISYAYRDITPDYRDSVYYKAGFTFDGYTIPSLFYYVRHNLVTPNGTILKEGVYSRIKFQKFKLFKDFGFTKELKDYQIYKVYDSGNLKFHLDL